MSIMFGGFFIGAPSIGIENTFAGRDPLAL
jgi:hypothetical protein